MDWSTALAVSLKDFLMLTRLSARAEGEGERGREREREEERGRERGMRK